MNVEKFTHPRFRSLMALVFLFFAATPLIATAAPACPATVKGPSAISAGSGVPNGGATWWTDAALVASFANQGSDISLCRYVGTKFTATPAGTTSESYRYDKIVKSMTAVLLRPKRSYVVLLFNSAFQFHCSGVAITPEWVLTTRHCVNLDATDPRQGTLIGGMALGGGDALKGVFHDAKSIDRVDFHPTTDLAMVHLTSPIVLRSYARIGTQAPSTGTTGTMYSWMCWSDTNDPTACPLGSSTLRENPVANITENNDCQAIASWSGDYYRAPLNKSFCVKGASSFVIGDEGSPLVIDDQTVVGIDTGAGVVLGSPSWRFLGFITVKHYDIRPNDGFFVDVTWPDNLNWIAGYQGLWSWFPGW